VLNLLLFSQIGYEVSVGDPLSGSLRFYGALDTLPVVFRAGVGVGGLFTYLNLHLLADALYFLPVSSEASVYVGLGFDAGVRFVDEFDIGSGVRLILGAEVSPLDRILLGFEFAPLVIRSLDGGHPGISFGLKGTYFPKKKFNEERVENGRSKRVRARTIKRSSTSSKSKSTSRTSSSATSVDLAAAEREYKLGLQAYANGDLHRAEKHFMAALRYNPQHDRARIALEKIRRQLGK